MKKADLWKVIWLNLWRRKVRTALTTFGVIIGTSAIVTMISLGAGMQKNITEQLEGSGSFTELNVMPKYDLNQSISGPEKLKPITPLDDKIINQISNIKHVEAISPIINISGAELITSNYVANTLIRGMKTNYLDKEMVVEQGRPLRPGDNNVMIVGNKLGEQFQKDAQASNVQKLGKRKEDEEGENKNEEKIELFRKTVNLIATKINQNGVIEEKNFRLSVVGVLVETGQQEDFLAIIPLEIARDIKTWVEGVQSKDFSYDSVLVKVDSTHNIETVQKEIEELGFSIFSLKQMLEVVGVVFKFIEVLLGGIGSIALFVASFGIINTMIMSIYERTSEIGIMKVIGATVHDIRIMFILEAGAIGFIGGMIGLSLSWLGVKTINYIANIYLSKGSTEMIELLYIPLWLAIFAVSFSSFIGLLAGVYPAMRAAKLSPLDAIRQQ